MFAFAYVISRSDLQPKWLLDFQFQSFPWPWRWAHYLSSSSDVRDGGLLLVCDFFCSVHSHWHIVSYYNRTCTNGHLSETASLPCPGGQSIG